MPALSYFIALAITFIFFLLFFSSIGIGVYSVYVTPVIREVKLIKSITPRQREILARYFTYYQDLHPKLKREFERRVRYFLIHKDFTPRKMEKVTEQMKVLVSASAVQLTFGFKPLKFSNFNKIILYPEQYISTHTGKKHRGEVNSNGIIVLSWQDFLKGYKSPHDGFNVGLHEMAHALQVSDAFSSEEYAFMEEDSLRLWHRVSGKEYNRIRKGEQSFLRKYAGKSLPEFFAVCVEHFFEQPEVFKAKLPDLYKALSNLLKQDPINSNFPIV
ncbi:MAG TPA: zinc-dependent peptidase [Cytophagaceae bacterium]